MDSFFYEHHGDSDSSWEFDCISYNDDPLSFDCQVASFTYPGVKQYVDQGVQTELCLSKPGSYICSPFRGIMSAEEVARELNNYIKQHK